MERETSGRRLGGRGGWFFLASKAKKKPLGAKKVWGDRHTCDGLVKVKKGMGSGAGKLLGLDGRETRKVGGRGDSV